MITINNEGAFDSSVRTQVNANFAEAAANALVGTVDTNPTGDIYLGNNKTIYGVDNGGGGYSAMLRYTGANVVEMATGATFGALVTFAAEGWRMSAIARTATADGTGEGAIAAGPTLQFIAVTSALAANQIKLPTPTPGSIVILGGTANGYDLKTTNPATIGINGGTGAAVKSGIAANTLAILICESATSWKGLQLGADGTLAKVPVAV